MRFFWKVLLVVLPLGSYWLYKKSSNSPAGDTEVQSRQAEEEENDSKRPADHKKEQKVPTAQIIERLTEIDGVTSRVAENLVEKGIYSREALTSLSRDELMEIKGIGPKRAKKILGM
jgi:ERCC4-type nuclease